MWDKHEGNTMKNYIRLMLVLCMFASVLQISFINAVFGQPTGGEGNTSVKHVYIGTPTVDREAGMQFWMLTLPGEEKELLGAPYEFQEKNSTAASCIEKAIEKEQQIRISGTWIKEDGEEYLDITTAICQPIRSSADCPDKVIATRTIEGIYKGVECGDSCYLGLKLGKDKTILMYADEDEVAKLFGEKPGKKVSVTYTLEQMWMKENIEDERPDAPGWCQIAEVFKTGKILGK